MNVATKRILLQLALLSFFAFGSILGNVRAITPETLGSWIVVSLLTALAGTVTVDLAWFIQLRRHAGHPLPAGAAAAISFLVGCVFALTQFFGMRAFDVMSDRDPLLAALSSIVSITIIGVAISRLAAGRYVEQQRRNHLLDQGIAVSMAREDVSEIAHRTQVALGTAIDDALAPARRGIEERLVDQQRALHQDDWAVVARELRAAARDTVRPLSRQLWSNTAGRATPIRASQVLRNIITTQPFRPVPLSLILIVTGLVSSITLFGWVLGLVWMGLGVALIFLILCSFNSAMDRWPAHHAVLFVIGALVLQSATLFNFPLREWQRAQPYTWAEAIAAILIGLTLILLTSGAGSLRNYRDDVARTFQTDIDRELMESVVASRQVAQLARESARILHGTVQTRLIACAVAIERAAQTRDVDAFQSALREARDVLMEPAWQEASDDAILSDEVQRKVSLWSGLCMIDIDIAPGLGGIGGRTARDVGRVVEEGLNNAIRHGAATTIHVRVHDSNLGVVVEVEDNGVGPMGGPRGLGSSLLDSVSDSWELTPSMSGARLLVQLS